MEIILLENILNLGNIGDKVKVKDGYGRNFLLKKGKALRFNKENLDFVNKKKDELNRKNTEMKNKFKEIAKLVNNKTFSFIKEYTQIKILLNMYLAHSSKPRKKSLIFDSKFENLFQSNLFHLIQVLYLGKSKLRILETCGKYHFHFC